MCVRGPVCCSWKTRWGVSDAGPGSLANLWPLSPSLISALSPPSPPPPASSQAARDSWTLVQVDERFIGSLSRFLIQFLSFCSTLLVYHSQLSFSYSSLSFSLSLFLLPYPSLFLPISLFFSKSLSLSLHLLFLSLPLFLSPYPSLSQHLSLHPFSSMQRKRKWGMNVQGIGCSDNPLKSRFLKCSFEIPSKCSRTPLHSIPCSDCYISIRNFTYSFSQLFKRVSWNYCSISQNCKHTWTIPRWQFPMMVLPRHLVLVKLNPASSMNMYPWGKALASGSNILWKKRKWPYQTIGQNTGTLRCMATCLYRVLKGCGQLQ